MSRNRSLSCVVAFIVALSASRAEAQQRGFALDRYDPAERGSDWFGVESLDLRGHLRPAVGLTLDWGHKPLVLYDANGNELTALVKEQLFLHAGGALVLWNRVRVGANVPIAVFQDGNAGPTALPTPEGAAFGDVRLGLDVRVLGAYRSPLTLAGGLQLFVPTGSRGAYTSDGKARVIPRIMAAGRVARLEYAGTLSVNARFLDTQFAGTPVASEIHVALAGGMRLLGDALIVGPELYLSTGISRSSAFFGRRTTPVELLAGAHYTLLRDFRVGLAAGPGLSRGLGTPEVRVLLSFDWVPSPAPRQPGEQGDQAPAVRIDRSANQIRIEQVTFEFDSAVIRPESEPALSAIAKLLTEEPRMKVRIEGHTDNLGEAPYNKELSERRAGSVLKWLVDHGIDAARLTSVGRGQEEPIASNDTEAGRQKNRRVEFIIVEPR